MPTNLLDKIDSWLISKERRPRTSHYPSDVTACQRQLYYKWTGEPISRPIEPGSLWKMKMGDSLHDMIFDFLKSAGLDIIQEVEFKLDLGLKYKLSGRLDCVFVDEDKSLAGLEIKTSFGRGIVEIQKSQEPKPEHIAQVFCYIKSTDIKRFYLLYLGRDSGYRCQFVFEFIDNVLCYNGHPIKLTMDQIKQKLLELELSVDTKTLPDRGFKAVIKNGEVKEKVQKDGVDYKSPWQCLYCDFKETCWTDECAKYKEGSNI